MITYEDLVCIFDNKIQTLITVYKNSEISLNGFWKADEINSSNHCLYFKEL